MESNLTVTRTDFKERASILTALTLDFKFPTKSGEFNGKDIAQLVFQDLSKADDIQLALNTSVIRNILTLYYNATFTRHRVLDSDNPSEKRTRLIWKIRNMEGGLLAPNLEYEFPGVPKIVSKEYSREQRFTALLSNIMSKFTMAESTPISLGIRSTDERSFSGTTLEGFADVISSAMRPTSSAKSKSSSSGTLSDINKVVMKEASKVSVNEIKEHRGHLKAAGLNSSDAYSEGKYDEPVANINLRIEIAKTTTPLFFDLIMELICGVNFKEKSKAIYERYDKMNKLMNSNTKNGLVTTAFDMAHTMYGDNRVPQSMKDLLNGTSSTAPSSSSFNTSLSVSTDTSDPPLNNDEIIAEIVNIMGMAVTGNEAGNLKKEGMAATICELILQMRENGHGLTPTGVELGLIASLCGLSNQGQDIFSMKGITCGRSTVKKVLKGLGKSYENYVNSMLKNNHGNKKFKILIIFDNYNLLRWLKRIKSDVPFTQHTPSISILAEILSCEEPSLGA
jgi:hypothetical protein